METSSLRILGITIIVIVNSVATVITLAFWILVLSRFFGGAHLYLVLEKASVASTLGFIVADFVWAIPLLIMSVIGLWHLRFWGWMAAQLVNILWFYSLTAAWVRDLYLVNISLGNLLFLPFALFAMWSTVYLWNVRNLFWTLSKH